MISVVESYLTSEISYQKLALQVGINNPALLARCVYKYKTAGSDALRSHRKGRKKLNTTKSGNNGIQEVQNTEIDTRVEHVKELEDELLKRRIKNAFFKLKDLLSYANMPKATYMYWQKMRRTRKSGQRIRG